MPRGSSSTFSAREKLSTKALIGHRLEGRERVEVDYAGAALHVRQRELRHGDEGLVVYIYHIQIDLKRRLREERKTPEARDVAERRDEGLFLLEQLFVLVKARRVAEVHGQDARRGAQLLGEVLQPLAPAGDEPYLVEYLLRVDGFCKLQPHTRAGAGDNRYFHYEFLHSELIVPCIMPQAPR